MWCPNGRRTGSNAQYQASAPLRYCRVGLVYIEQPEVHLHPRAGGTGSPALSQPWRPPLVAERAARSCCLAYSRSSPRACCRRRRSSCTGFSATRRTGSRNPQCDSRPLRRAYGNWPMDFLDVSMDASLRYTEAAFEQLKNGSHGREWPQSALVIDACVIGRANERADAPSLDCALFLSTVLRGREPRRPRRRNRPRAPAPSSLRPMAGRVREKRIERAATPDKMCGRLSNRAAPDRLQLKRCSRTVI